MLADLDLRELKSNFGPGRLRAYTKNTICAVTQLTKVCMQIKTRGFATDDGEFLEGMRCLAAPIRAESGMIIGSISISAPSQRFPEERYRLCARQVLAVAKEISAQLVTTAA